MERRIPSKFVCLDFETYFAKDYTLRSPKWTTTNYIRDPRFKAQCVGLQGNRASQAKWYPLQRIAPALKKIDWTTTGVLCHHAQFDGLILSHHYGIVPAFYFCTLSMARAIHGGDIRAGLESVSKYYGGRGKIEDYLMPTKGIRDLPKNLMHNLGEGCARDVEETMRVFNEMRYGYPDDELQLIDTTVRMYADPILQIDKQLAQEELEREQARRAQAVNAVRRIVKKGVPEVDVKNDSAIAKSLRSREVFATLLRNNGCEPPTKVSKDTGEDTYAFAKSDLKFQELSTHPSKTIRALVEAKGVVSSTIGETKPARMLEHADPAFPVYLAYGKAKTLRWTGGDKVNLQAMDRKTKLRNCIIAPPGYTLIIGDSGQIEDRVNCEMAGQEDVVEAYRKYDAGKGPDVYRIMAGTIYNKKPENVNDAQRFVGKVSRLQLGYQSGMPKFDYTLKAGLMGPPVKLPAKELHSAFWGYRNSNYAIVNQWARMQDMLLVIAQCKRAVKMGPLSFERNRVGLPNGMYVRYPKLRGVFNPNRNSWGDFIYNEDTHIYGGKLVENLIQALARIIVANQLLAALNEMQDARIVLLVHDEGVFCVKLRYATKAAAILNKHLRVPAPWLPNCPVTGKVVISPFYLKD